MKGKYNFVIDYQKVGVKVSYDSLTPGRAGIVFGSIKIKAL